MELEFAPVIAPLELQFSRAPSAVAEFSAAYVGPMGRVEGGLNIIGMLPEMSDLPETAGSGDAYLIDGYLIVWTQGGWINAGPMVGQGGTGGATYQHTQTVPSTVWTVAHNLAKRPSVSVTDHLGNAVLPDIKYLDENIVQVTHGVPLTGFVYCN